MTENNPVYEYKISAILRQGYAIDLTFLSENTNEDEIKENMIEAILKPEFKISVFLEKPTTKEDFIGWKIKRTEI